MLAFTLAETLVVIGIIGVVAALTLPNLNSSTGDKEKVVKMKKIYSDLNNALGRATAVYGPYKTWCISGPGDTFECSQKCFNRIMEFMKYSKICTISDSCALVYQESNGSNSGGSSYRPSALLADGASIALNGGGSDGNKFYIDLDGPYKGNSRDGVDVFDFKIKGNGVYTSCNREQEKWYERKSCRAMWMIENENMDFLKCASKLNWQTQTSCK
ncbi:type II secretion system protein [bacterium]|nr:type II secretion system protein [bacterium]